MNRRKLAMWCSPHTREYRIKVTPRLRYACAWIKRSDIDTAGGKNKIVDHEVVDGGGVSSFQTRSENSSTILTEFIVRK